MVGTGVATESVSSHLSADGSSAADLVSLGRFAMTVAAILVTQSEQALGYAGLHGDGWQRL